MKRAKRALVAVLVLAAFGGAASAAVALMRGGDGAAPARDDASVASAAQSNQPSSLRTRFAVLSRRHSNRCGMPASALDTMAPGARLQGACCFPMDYGSYVNQVRVLNRRYADVDLIPKDPYDIPVSLAKRLIAYESIELTSAQQRTYDRAKPLSATKGPCWRWDAFGGQAKYLITRRHYTAKQTAAVWSAEEGCGGPSHRDTQVG